MESFEKNYEPVRKKYSLPAFEELDREFDIHCIEDSTFILRELRHKIADYADGLCIMLEEVLQPDTKVSNLYESRIFTEADKESIFLIFKKLMTLRRKAALLSLRNIEKEDAQFVIDSYVEWLNLKKKLEPVFQKLVDAWQTDSDIKEHLSYFG